MEFVEIVLNEMYYFVLLLCKHLVPIQLAYLSRRQKVCCNPTYGNSKLAGKNWKPT